MDWIQLHLALNHVPVIGFPILLFLLLIAWWRKNEDFTRVLLWTLTSLAVAAIATKFTGDFAAEQKPELFAPVEDYITRHEEAGDQATTGVFFLGIATAIALFLSRNGKPSRPWSIWLVLLLGLATVLLYVRTAHSGGQISHPELRVEAKTK